MFCLEKVAELSVKADGPNPLLERSVSANPPRGTTSQPLELSLGVEHWQAALFSGILCKKQAGKKENKFICKGGTDSNNDRGQAGAQTHLL